MNETPTSPDERARKLYRLVFSKDPEGNAADCRFLRIAASEFRTVEEEAFRRGHDAALGEILRDELPEANASVEPGIELHGDGAP